MTQKSTDLVEADGKHAALTERVLRVFYDVYNELGYGFLESTYQEAMRLALMDAGLRVKTQMPIPVHFRGRQIGVFRADLVVEEAVLLELKAGSALVREHQSQTLNYLRATDLEVALLLNFGPAPTVKRLVLDNERKRRA